MTVSCPAVSPLPVAPRDERGVFVIAAAAALDLPGKRR